ncbi:hypothetical protein [Oceanobacillus manasiensis]|uniref:hypothetical protein n=1 Tax=Oceanobacillus manasiensis TaxID=586413 RepID=UPI0005A6BEDE|nr:hypothetical protein [Oceanobacillus manasiensis]
MKVFINSIIIVIIFLLGYILGNKGVENIVSTLIRQYSNTSFVTLVGNIASIITVLLFFTYIIGKVFLIKQMEKTLFESLDVTYIDKENHYKITEVINLGELTNEKVYICVVQNRSTEMCNQNVHNSALLF